MRSVEQALQDQGGAYTLEMVTPEGQRSHAWIRAIREVIPWDAHLSSLIAAGASEATRIISFTVTEAGYYLDAQDRLDLSAPDLHADLHAARQGLAGTTLYGTQTAMLRACMHALSGAVTLLCCDNLRHNGRRSRAGLLQFINLVDDAALLKWVQNHTRSPNCMVDRITPRPMPEVAARINLATGQNDRAALMAESFIQWVIEDDFIHGRPAWERVGVEMVASVTPYEEAKIRLLNATHSCIAWAGVLAGYRFIHEGARDMRIRAFAHEYATRAAIPALSPSPMDLPAYRDVVLARFGNDAILDTNERVASDSFTKIPGFITSTIADLLRVDADIDAVAMLPAFFLAFLRRWASQELPFEYHDRAMDFSEAKQLCAAVDPVTALANSRTLFGKITGDPRLVKALHAATRRVGQFETACVCS